MESSTVTATGYVSNDIILSCPSASITATGDATSTAEVVSDCQAVVISPNQYAISASHALVADYALNATAASSGTSLGTGSSYPITSSWAVSASWAPSGASTGYLPTYDSSSVTWDGPYNKIGTGSYFNSSLLVATVTYIYSSNYVIGAIKTLY